MSKMHESKRSFPWDKNTAKTQRRWEVVNELNIINRKIIIIIRWGKHKNQYATLRYGEIVSEATKRWPKTTSAASCKKMKNENARRKYEMKEATKPKQQQQKTHYVKIIRVFDVYVPTTFVEAIDVPKYSRWCLAVAFLRASILYVRKSPTIVADIYHSMQMYTKWKMIFVQKRLCYVFVCAYFLQRLSVL